VPDPVPDPTARPTGPGLVVAVDGPSGSGKSSVSRAVASHLGLAYLDTGAMYRAVAWWCREQGTDLEDRPAVGAAARAIDLRLGTDPADPTVHVGSTDVAGEIRERAISAVVSAVATNLEVRAELQRRQREIIAAAATHGAGIVAEGRDITTVVAPDADVRVLLTADEDARLRRRAEQDRAGDDEAEATRDQVLRRDRDDSTVSQFHTAADGVVTVDSSNLDYDQTVAAVLAVVERTTHQSTREASR
jgi:cytidylate kinase